MECSFTLIFNLHSCDTSSFLGLRPLGESGESCGLSVEKCRHPDTRPHSHTVSEDLGLTPQTYPAPHVKNFALQQEVRLGVEGQWPPLSRFAWLKTKSTPSVPSPVSQIANKLHYLQMEIFVRQEIDIFSRPPHNTYSEEATGEPGCVCWALSLLQPLALLAKGAAPEAFGVSSMGSRLISLPSPSPVENRFPVRLNSDQEGHSCHCWSLCWTRKSLKEEPPFQLHLKARARPPLLGIRIHRASV